MTLAESDQNIPQPDLAGLASAYREVLATTDDPAVNLLARHRLADILVQQGEATLSRRTQATARHTLPSRYRFMKTCCWSTPTIIQMITIPTRQSPCAEWGQ